MRHMLHLNTYVYGHYKYFPSFRAGQSESDPYRRHIEQCGVDFSCQNLTSTDYDDLIDPRPVRVNIFIIVVDL